MGHGPRGRATLPGEAASRPAGGGACDPIILRETPPHAHPPTCEPQNKAQEWGSKREPSVKSVEASAVP